MGLGGRVVGVRGAVLVDRAGIVPEVWRSHNDPSRVIRNRRWCRLWALSLFPFASVQSPSVMSQKRHSLALGAVGGGSGAAMRRMRVLRLRTKPWSIPPWGTPLDAVAVDDLASDACVAVLGHGPG